MIDKKIITHIAKLARLKISSEESDYYSDQLSKVLNHFDQISKIDTTGVDPMVSPLEPEFFSETSFRSDTVHQKFTAEEMLQNAPDKMGNLFKVPPVVG
jgi:aspartyl-tRNA(Asn)/glutamyl-tRNA(Gln) amidotransferase subunit C